MTFKELHPEVLYYVVEPHGDEYTIVPLFDDLTTGLPFHATYDRHHAIEWCNALNQELS